MTRQAATIEELFRFVDEVPFGEVESFIDITAPARVDRWENVVADAKVWDGRTEK